MAISDVNDKCILTDNSDKSRKKRLRKKNVHPDVAISSLSQQQSVDVAANSTVSELSTNITDFVDKSMDLEALREKLSVEVGYSSINHPDEPGLGRLLSALTDNSTLIPSMDSVSKVKQSVVSTAFLFYTVGLLTIQR